MCFESISKYGSILRLAKNKVVVLLLKKNYKISIFVKNFPDSMVKTKYFYQKGVLYVKGEKSDAYMWN